MMAITVIMMNITIMMITIRFWSQQAYGLPGFHYLHQERNTVRFGIKIVRIWFKNMILMTAEPELSVFEWSRLWSYYDDRWALPWESLALVGSTMIIGIWTQFCSSPQMALNGSLFPQFLKQGISYVQNDKLNQSSPPFVPLSVWTYSGKAMHVPCTVTSLKVMRYSCLLYNTNHHH